MEAIPGPQTQAALAQPTQIISLQPQTTPTISLNQSSGLQNTADQIEDYAVKYDQVLGDISPGVASVQNALQTNNKDALAGLLQQKQEVDLVNARNATIQAIANQSGSAPSPADLDAVAGLTVADVTKGDLGTALEREYGKQVTNAQAEASNAKTGQYDQSILADPGTTSEVLDRAEYQTARNMISNDILDKLQKQFGSSGLLTQGQAFLQTLVPFRSWIALSGSLDRPGFDLLPGSSLQNQFAYLHTLSPDQYKSSVQGVVDKLVGQGDYLDAIQFVQGTLSYGNDDANWQNIFAGLDVASVVPVGGLIKALKGSSKLVGIASHDAEAIASVTGQGAKAADIALAKDFQTGRIGSVDINNLSDVEKNFSSIDRPQEYFTDTPTKASGPPLTRLQTAALARAARAHEFFFGINKIDRETPEGLANAVTQAQDDVRQMFVRQSHNIVNVTANEPDNVTNISSVTAKFGQVNGDWFPTKNAAEGWAGRFVKLKTNDYSILEEGTGWSVNVTRNVDETKAGARNFTIETDAKSADDMFTRFASPLLGADKKLSKSQTRARGVVVMSEERANEVMKSFAEPLATLQKNKRAFKEFNDFMVAARDHVDPVRGRGVTYHTQAEFEDAWYDQFQHLPSYEQSDAYSSFKQFYDMDWVTRNLDVYKQKSILGIEKITVPHSLGFSEKTLPDGTVSLKAIGTSDKATKIVNQDPVTFEGKVIGDLPRGQRDHFSIGLIDEKGVLNRYNTRFMTGKTKGWEVLDKAKADGYQIIQPYEGYAKIGADTFDYVMTKTLKRDRPTMDLNYREGTRVVQKYNWYIKQPRLSIQNGSARYLGDLALANARDEHEAGFIRDTMNTARQMVLKKDAGAEKYFTDNLPMWSYKDFQKAVHAAGMDPRIPFSITRAGSRTIDSGGILGELNKAGLKINNLDKGDVGRLSNQVRGRFLGERDETNMTAWGVEKGKIFELAGDSQLSPLETMKLSMSDLVDVNLMNDYKIKSVRDFTSQFGHLLDGTEADFRANGLAYIYDPKYLTGANANEIRSAEGIRKAILNLWQHSTVVDKQIGLYKEKIVRSLRGVLGDHRAEWVGDKVLPKIQNADAYMRAFAFHTKMGFFNPKQLFLQMSSVVNIFSISPKYGIRAAALASPMKAGLYARPGILRAIGEKLAGTVGMKADDYEELVTLYKRSGFDLVKNDVSFIDDLSPPKFVRGKIGMILDAGTTPFKTGERIARSMAFATAYMEQKALKKGVLLGRNDEAQILQRAKDLTGNMTRDSNAPYQQGYTAVVTQFFGYQMRLMEQMFGSKLTGAEKGRLLFGMSLMYGAPVAAGMTFGVVPFREWIKDWLQGSGIQTDNTMAEPFIDGFAATFLHAISGTNFNVAERYGPGGITTFYDFLKGDSSATELLLGASGGIIGDTVSDFDPIVKWFTRSIDGNDMTSFTPSTADILRPLTEISTVNTAEKLWRAVELGKWMSKNETNLTNVSDLEAGISAVLGVDPERVSDAFRQIGSMQARKDMQDRSRKAAVSEYRRAIQALQAGDNDLATQYFQQYKGELASAGFSPYEQTRIAQQAISDTPMNESVFNQMQKYENQK